MINFSLSPGVKFDADHTDDRIILIDGRIGDEYFPPVSYTHLDVYKRQDHDHDGVGKFIAQHLLAEKNS